MPGMSCLSMACPYVLLCPEGEQVLKQISPQGRFSIAVQNKEEKRGGEDREGRKVVYLGMHNLLCGCSRLSMTCVSYFTPWGVPDLLCSVNSPSLAALTDAMRIQTRSLESWGEEQVHERSTASTPSAWAHQSIAASGSTTPGWCLPDNARTFLTEAWFYSC